MSKIRTRWNMIKSVENTVIRYGMFNENNYTVSIMFSTNISVNNYYRSLVRHMMLIGERLKNRKIK